MIAFLSMNDICLDYNMLYLYAKTVTHFVKNNSMKNSNYFPIVIYYFLQKVLITRYVNKILFALKVVSLNLRFE